MQSRKRNKPDLRALCAQPYPDDGLNPRDDKRRRGVAEHRGADRKLQQLCKQAARTLHLALGALPDADRLAEVAISTVYPAPHAGRLRCVLTVPDPERREEVAAVVGRHAGRLRAELAAAITRRRAPELVFEVVVEGGHRG